jgi:hypothetical protein
MSNIFPLPERTNLANPSEMPVELDSIANQTAVKMTDGQSEDQTREAAAQQESATIHGESASD